MLFSEYEAHPVAVIEALSLRRPVLVSDTSGLGELAAKRLCRAIPRDAGPSDVAAAIAEELEARREVPDLTLPDWDDCAQALSEVREVVQDLVPYHLDTLGLAETVREMAAKVGAAAGISIDCKLAELDNALSTADQMSLFRIIQEAINNVVKHSGARSASIASFLPSARETWRCRRMASRSE